MGKRTLGLTLKYAFVTSITNMIGFTLIAFGIYLLLGEGTSESIGLIADNGQEWLEDNYQVILETYKEEANLLGFGLMAIGYTVMKMAQMFVKVSLGETASSSSSNQTPGMGEHNF